MNVSLAMPMAMAMAMALSLSLLFGCASTRSSQPAGSSTCRNALPRVVNHGARGVVLPSHVARRDLSLRRKDVEDYWVPSEDDVGEVETSLRDALKGRLAEATGEPPSPDRDADVAALEHIIEHLGTYLRQYAGLVVNGNKRVFVNAFPDDTYCYRDALVVIEDGGAWFWTIQYDVKLHQFLHWELAGRRTAKNPS